MIRVFNRLLCFLFGAVFFAGGLLVIIEAVATWTNSGFLWIPGNQWLSTFKTTAWSAAIVIGISVAVAAVGALLALFEMKPQRKRVAEFKTDVPGTWYLLRRSTEGHLSRRLSKRTAVSPIKVRLTPRPLLWKVAVKAKAAEATRTDLETATKDEVAALCGPSSTRVRVRTTGATAPPS